MKVFIFCFAFLLLGIVSGSPIQNDGEEVDVPEFVPLVELDAVDVPEEPEVEAVDEMAQDIDVNDDDSQVPVEEEIDEIVDETRMLDDDNDDTNEVSVEDLERRDGLEIALCMQHNDWLYPLHLSHLTDCQKFYKCFDGRGYLMDCPSGEHWGVELDRCDYAEFAKCKVDGTYQTKVRNLKPVQANTEDVNDDAIEVVESEVVESEVDPRCENSKDPFKPLHFQHPNDCAKFYKCYLGKAYVIKCPKGQQWSQKMNRCDHASLARCVVMKPVPVQANVEEEEEIANDIEDDVEDVVRNEVEDAVVYVAEDVVADIAEEVVADVVEDIIEDVVEEHIHTIMDDPDYIITDERCIPNSDRFHPIQFVHPLDCNYFYKCSDEIAFKHQCPSTLHFNEKLEICDYPENAACRLHQIKPSPAQQIEDEIDDVVDDLADDLVEDVAEDVVEDVVADVAEDVVEDVVRNEVEDAVVYVAEDVVADIAEEVVADVVEDIIEDVVEEHIHTIMDDPDYIITDERCIPNSDRFHPIQFVHPLDCNYFYKCSDEIAFKHQCPSTLHFNEKLEICDYPENAACRLHQIKPSPAQQVLVPTIPVCPMNSGDKQVNFPLETFPKRYFACIAGNAYMMECQGDEMYNRDSHKCELPSPVALPPTLDGLDFPVWMPRPNLPIPEMPLVENPSVKNPTVENPTVKEPSKPSFNINNGKFHTGCPENDDPMNPVHLAHESECGKFYKCYNRRAFLMDCPIDQEWSEELERCDFHMFAMCDPVELIKRKIQN